MELYLGTEEVIILFSFDVNIDDTLQTFEQNNSSNDKLDAIQVTHVFVVIDKIK